jgi:ribosome assembly protein 4
VAWSSDSRLFVSGSKDSTLKVRTRQGAANVLNVWTDWEVHSKNVVCRTTANNPQVWDLRTHKLMVDLPGHADEVYAVDWSPDGSGVASGGKDQVVKLWRH